MMWLLLLVSLAALAFMEFRIWRAVFRQINRFTKQRLN